MPAYIAIKDNVEHDSYFLNGVSFVRKHYFLITENQVFNGLLHSMVRNID